jgi:hypothetical protein
MDAGMVEAEKAAFGAAFFDFCPYLQNTKPGWVSCQRLRRGSSLFSGVCPLVMLDNGNWEIGGGNLLDSVYRMARCAQRGLSTGALLDDFPLMVAMGE